MRSKLEWSTFNNNNVHTLDFKGADYLVYYPEKQFVHFHLPQILFGSTYQQLMRYLLTFIYLNPDQTDDVFKEVLIALHINCENKISDSEIQKILEEAILLKNDPDLETIVLQANKHEKKNFKGSVINPEVPSDKKGAIKGIARGDYQRTKTTEQIKTTLTNWNPYWGEPTNKLIANKAKLSLKQVNTYIPLLKSERKKASLIKKPRPSNKTFKLLWKTLLNWDLSIGIPTNKDLVKATGLGLSTIEVYSPSLKGLKKKIRAAIKDKNDNRTRMSIEFAPFDQKNYVNQEAGTTTEEIQNEMIEDSQFLMESL
ncbi:hypothetical protein [Maribacter luteus]|uniref:hypothetical protein n=1 Tax=Maribacter luteus TaxID=2594478 RepID=UPI002492678F|nr:hypothetical protein [Maribacter luteus]